MSFAATAAAIGAGTAIYMGSQQRRAAKNVRENTQDPGIQPNYALDRVTSTLHENYSNWNLPGYSRMEDQIQTSQATSNRDAARASTSSADILNAITQNQGAADNAMSNLNIAQASGKEQALMRYLDSVQQQGQDQIRMNGMELNRYDASMREAAALEGAGIQNMNSGFQDALIGTSAIAGNFMPRNSIDANTGEKIKLDSVWTTLYSRKRNGNKI